MFGLHEGPWNAVDRQVTQMNRKGNALLGLIATKDRNYLPPNVCHQAMLGKVDQMRSMLDEIERIVKELSPETQMEPDDALLKGADETQ